MNVSLTDRELATVLASLRFWRDEMSPHDGPPCYPEHFTAFSPLTAEEIDALCNLLNQPET